MGGSHIGIRRVALAAGLLLLASGCGRSDGKPGAFPPPEVAVLTIEPHSVEESFEFPGQVQPFRRVEVRARVDGIIEARPFTEGAIVKSGDLLYRLDKVRYQAAFDAAQAHYQNSKLMFDRAQALLVQNAVPPQDVDNARAESVAAQSALDQAKKDLDDTDVRAQIEGRIGRTNFDVGARVTGPSDLLTTIDRLDPVYVSFFPSAQQLLEWRENPRWRSLVQRGSRLEVQAVLPDGSLLPRLGHLDFVAPSLDASTGTQEFRALFENPDHLLMPGEFVRVRLRGFARDSALAVPQRAVQAALGRQFVYVVGAGDTVRARDVEPGPWAGDQWIIERGLAPGDRVIVDGLQKVAPGRPAKPVPIAAEAAGSAPGGAGP
jgi:membrane fusion protein (multidrug efflux system)